MIKYKGVRKRSFIFLCKIVLIGKFCTALRLTKCGLLVKIVHKIGAIFTYWSKIVHKWGKFAPFVISI